MTKKVKVKIRGLKETDLFEGSGYFETLAFLTKAPVIEIGKAKQIMKQFEQSSKKVFVAEVEGHGIVSTTTLMIEPKFIHSGRPVAHIEDVVTIKKWEKKGIGSKLMEAAIKKAKQQGCYKVILDCSPENVKFYQDLDFRECEIQMRRDL
jgi:glucosamine-phosphate N-acetyltransferase